MSGRLQGKTALITGAASGIGAAIALAYAREGARVALADRDHEGAARVAAQVQESGTGEALAVEVDIANEESVMAAFAQVREHGWLLDTVVANAGVQLFGQDQQVADLPLEVWQRTVDINLTGTFLTVKHGVRALRADGNSGGSIVLMGSPTGLTGEGNEFTAYSTTKAGIHGLGRTAAAAYAGDGIRVNTIVPGYTETPLVTTISGDDQARSAIVSRVPLGRAGRAEDVEGMAIFLASDEASFATGAIFRVDGGMTSL